MDWQEHPVQAYLMACYAYEELAAPFLTDAEFDQLGREISRDWDKLTHRHKNLIDRDSCMFTSAITEPYHRWPLIILNATHQLTKAPYGPVWQKALERFNVVDDLL